MDIISEAGLLGAKPNGFPMQQNHKLGCAAGKHLADPEVYHRLVGRLIYLAVTRLDLAYSVHILSQFIQEPRTLVSSSACSSLFERYTGSGYLIEC